MLDIVSLPLVSVVIVNFNYAKFLKRAYDSVISQSYPHIQIVFVDDASTDDSVEIMDAIQREHSDVIVVKLKSNGGQSIASREGFIASSGSYLIFLDADDVLLPRCVETHIYAHLSSRIAIAFSSVDIFNNVGGSDVSTSNEGFGAYVQSKQGQNPAAVRPIDAVSPEGYWFAGRSDILDVQQIHFVLPPYCDPWIWSPASANCYRRDAVLIMFDQSAPLDLVRWGTDLYLMRALSGLFGSILIDKPLMRYMIHGGNSFAKGAPLNKYLMFDSRVTSDYMLQVTRLILAHLLKFAEYNAHRYGNPFEFFSGLRSIARSWPGSEMMEQADDHLRDLISTNRVRLTEIFGTDVVRWALALDRQDTNRPWSATLFMRRQKKSLVL